MNHKKELLWSLWVSLGLQVRRIEAVGFGGRALEPAANRSAVPIAGLAHFCAAFRDLNGWNPV